MAIIRSFPGGVAWPSTNSKLPLWPDDPVARQFIFARYPEPLTPLLPGALFITLTIPGSPDGTNRQPSTGTVVAPSMPSSTDSTVTAETSYLISYWAVSRSDTWLILTVTVNLSSSLIASGASIHTVTGGSVAVGLGVEGGEVGVGTGVTVSEDMFIEISRTASKMATKMPPATIKCQCFLNTPMAPPLLEYYLLYSL